MTASARITHIAPNGEFGGLLRVLRGRNSRARILFDGSAAAGPGSELASVDGPDVSFFDGDVVGGAPFILEGFLDKGPPLVNVSLVWECPELLSDDHVSTPQGYTVTLSEIGCPGSWPQALTLRPQLVGGSPWLTVELYGMPHLNRQLPLSSMGTSSEFVWKESGIEVKGAVTLESPGKFLDVYLDVVYFNGLPVCSGGGIRLWPEQ